MNELQPIAAPSLPPPPRSQWPNYRTVWRWHFYAGLFCIPFVIILSITGSIYLFKPQIEAWLDLPYDHLAMTGPPASAADQIHAALAALPGSTFNGYELPRTVDSAARVLVRQNDQIIRVYVHPETLQVLHTIPEDSRAMNVLFRLHGELLMGNRGSAIVELAASWTILMILSGLYLWWPRQAQGAGGMAGVGGILYPRVNRGSRIFWRDIHSVIGVWISALALFMLLTGLPWAKFWGDYFKAARHLAGTTVLHQDWTNGSPGLADVIESDSSMHSGHAMGPGHHHGAMMPVDFSAVNRVAAAVEPLHLPPPVVLAPVGHPSPNWTAKSLTDDRPKRVDLVIDGATGAVISRTNFQQRPLADRLVGTGIAAHEGQLFGWPNQLLGLLTASGLILLCVSAVILWWNRRETGVLGAPKFAPKPRMAVTFLIVVILLALYLPLFAASLILVLLAERIILRRLPGARRWLGLPPPDAQRLSAANV